MPTKKPLGINQLIAVCPFGIPSLAVASGVLCGFAGMGWEVVICGLILTAISVATILFLGKRSVALVLKMRNWYLLPVFLGCGSLGLIAWQLFAPPRQIKEDASHTYATALIRDIAEGNSGDKLQLEILYFSGIDQRHAPLNSPIKAIVYTDATPFKRGDVVRFRNFLKPIERDNSYGKWLYSTGVAWTQHVPSDRLKKVGHSSSLLISAANVRDNLSQFIETTSLDKETKGFLQALLLGDKSGLNPETRNEFASAGVAHLLALSGMHLGIVTLILATLLLPLSYLMGRRSRYYFLIVGVWAFTVVTGMSVSLVRAAIMTTVFLLSMLLQRKRTGMNSLFAAAFFILLFDPTALFNIGFQFSFLTCATLLLLSDYMIDAIRKSYEGKYLLVHSEWANKHPLLLKMRLRADSYRQQMMNVVYVALAAFGVSWVLSAFYFHNISLMFLPANIVALGLVWIIFLTVLPFLALSSLGLTVEPLTRFLDLCCSGLSKWCHLLDEFSSSWNFISIREELLGAYLLVMALAALWIVTRKSHWLWWSISGASATLLLAIFLPVNLQARGLEVGVRQGEPSIQYVAGEERKPLTYRRGEISQLSTPAGSVVIADAETLPYEKIDKECRLLMIARGCRDNASELIEHFQPKEIVFVSGSEEEHLEMIKEKEIALRNPYEERIFLEYPSN